MGAERYDFTTFGTSHLLMLGAFLVGCVVLVLVGRRHRGTEAAVRFSRVFAVVIPLFTVPMQVLQWTPAEWDLDTSLPLQICDVAWVLAVYALWTRKRWAAATNWLWGITLTSQAMITPDLASGWAEPRFWMFWGMHWVVVWSGVYLAWGLRIVPGWREYRITVALTVVWMVAVMAFNAVVGTNYGYLNRKPGGASILDWFGPWPGYVLVEIVVVASLWALFTWLWVRRGPYEPAEVRGFVG